MSPRVAFVLGKGGVGRTTLAVALGLAAARHGERVLVVEWPLEDPIGPWFGRSPIEAGPPIEIAPRLSVMAYSLDEALRAYFVDHLGLARFHRRVIRGAPVRALVESVPGIAELLFLGTLWWLITLAGVEVGVDFDRIVVDAPATGHGASIMELPAMLGRLHASALLGREVERVTAMMRDPKRSGAIVVATPEDLAIEEASELLPRLGLALGRPPIAAFVNRAVGPFSPVMPPQLRSIAALRPLFEELRARERGQAQLDALFAGKTEHGTFVLRDVLVDRGIATPRAVAEELSHGAEACL